MWEAEPDSPAAAQIHGIAEQLLREPMAKPLRYMDRRELFLWSRRWDRRRVLEREPEALTEEFRGGR